MARIGYFNPTDVNYRGLDPEDGGEWQRPYPWARPPVGYQNHDLWCGPNDGPVHDTIFLVPLPMREPPPALPPSAAMPKLGVTQWCPVTDYMVLQTMPGTELDLDGLQRCVSGRNRLQAAVQAIAEAACPWWLPSSLQTCCHPGYTDEQIRRRYAKHLAGPRTPPEPLGQPTRGWEETPFAWHGGRGRPYLRPKRGLGIMDRIAAAAEAGQTPPPGGVLTEAEYYAAMAAMRPRSG
jgi:hypothetical protein